MPTLADFKLYGLICGQNISINQKNELLYGGRLHKHRLSYGREWK